MNDTFHQNYVSLATHAAYYNLSESRSRILVTGSEALTWLHALVSNDLRKMDDQPRVARFAFFLDSTAHVLAEMRIFMVTSEQFTGQEGLLIDTAAVNGSSLLRLLDRYIITEDVKLQDVSSQTACIAIQGPNCLEYCDEADWWHCDLTGFGGSVLMLSSPEHRDEWLISHHNLPCASDETWGTARIECGLPQWDLELTPQILAAEADPRREFYSVTKGCYPGQEILARIDSRGHTNRQLFVLTAEPGTPIVPGTEVYLSGKRDRPIGAFCSCSGCSPACNCSAIGLAFLRTAEVSQDDTLFTSAGIPLTVTDQPRRRCISY